MEYEVVLIDATETPIERPKKNKIRVKNKKRIKNRNHKQKNFYSGKKRRHTLKSQLVVDKKTKQVICTAFTNGKRHDFRLFKESKTRIRSDLKIITNTGYQGIQKLHSQSELPKKKTKKNPLTKKDKKKNQELDSERVANENVIGMIKRFKIIS